MSKATLLVLALFLTGCATFQVDTINKRMAVFEIGYQEMLKTALLYKSEGRLQASQIAKLTELFHTIDQARNVAYAAIDAGDVDTASGSLQVASAALATVRQILLEVESAQRDSAFGCGSRSAQCDYARSGITQQGGG